MEKYILRYNNTFFYGNTLQDFDYVLGISIVPDNEHGNYRIMFNKDIELGCYKSANDDKTNGYTLSEVNSIIHTETFFKENFARSNLKLYKIIE